MLVGLQVTDERAYASYRDAAAPFLLRHGGAFGCDFRVAETLKADAGHTINRVFTLRFPSLEAKEAFFADPEYRAARERLFVPSVAGATILGRYTPLE